MWNLLDTWRQKDERSRRIAALSVSGGITLVIAIIWAVTFFSHSSEKTAVMRAEQAPGPFAAMRENVGEAFQTMKEQFSALSTLVTTSLGTTTATTTPVSTAADQQN
jgi:hypothetical protein